MILLEFIGFYSSNLVNLRNILYSFSKNPVGERTGLMVVKKINKIENRTNNFKNGKLLNQCYTKPRPNLPTSLFLGGGKNRDPGNEVER